MTVTTEAPQFKADQKLIQYTEEKLGKLSNVFARVIDCHVVFKLENSKQVRDKVAEVRINVPGSTLIARESQRTFEASVDLLSDNLRRQLKRYKARRRLARRTLNQ